MLRIICLVDNVAQGRLTWAEAGLSLLIQTEEARVLMDTGMSGTVLMHNCWRALGIDLLPLDAVFLSHGHSDHTGGLASVLDTAPGVRLFAHPGVFSERLTKDGDKLVGIGCPLARTEVEARCKLTLSADRVEVAPGIWSTGQITHRAFEISGSSHHLTRVAGSLEPDSYTDDMSLTIEAESGVVLVLGCCHAGLLNTLAHVKRATSRPIRAIVGGTHLGGISDSRLDAIAAVLESQYGSPSLALSHCTSPDVVFRLRRHLGNERVKYLAATSVLEL